MGYPQGLFTYPGIDGILGAAYALQHGISPGVFSFEIIPQKSTPPPFGTVQIWWGGSVVAEFEDCRIAAASLQFNAQGQVISLQVEDRRWRWAFNSIFGVYNLRKEDGRLWDAREKSPKELLELCFEAMGEENFDLSNCPDDARPTIEWEGDPPMQAAAKLADEIGARLILHTGGGVSVQEAGIGQELPDGWLTEAANVMQIPAWPDKVGIVCGRSRTEGTFDLEAVGKETEDNKSVWLPIDELSYKPDGGWGASSQKFSNVKDKEARKLAHRYIWRTYRIKDKNPLVEIDGYDGVVKSLDQILPIEDVLVKTSSDPETTDPAESQSLPAVIWGNYFTGTGSMVNTGSVTDTKASDEPTDDQNYPKDFRIDKNQGLIHFPDPVKIRDTTNNKWLEAKMKLRVAFSVRNSDSWAWERHTQTRDVSDGSGLGNTHWLRRDDVVFSQQADGTNNLEQLQEECNHYLDGMLAQYQIGQPQVVTFHGLRGDVDVDGAIHSISWQTGGGAPSVTKLCRNIEFDKLGPIPYRERRLRELHSANSKKFQKNSQTRPPRCG